jgi:hypothetical protein
MADMHSATQAAATLLMGLFALGALGCAITIPICAVRFIAVLFEGGDQEFQIAGYRLVPVRESEEPAAASLPVGPEATNATHRSRGAAAGK